jgi:nicotinamide-nucleotide amidase
VYIGIASPDGSVEGIKYQLSSQRERELIRRMSACQGLNLLRQKLMVGAK